MVALIIQNVKIHQKLESKYVKLKEIPVDTPGAFLVHNEDESEALQLELFKLGYKWNRQQTFVKKFSEREMGYSSTLPYWIFWDNVEHIPNKFHDVPGVDYSAPELFRTGTEMPFIPITAQYRFKDYFKLKHKYRGHNLKKFGI